MLLQELGRTSKDMILRSADQICDHLCAPQTTPEDLITGGLYKSIAIAFPPYPHRGASYALLARALGAVKIAKAMRDFFEEFLQI